MYSSYVFIKRNIEQGSFLYKKIDNSPISLDMDELKLEELKQQGAQADAKFMTNNQGSDTGLPSEIGTELYFRQNEINPNS